MCTPCLPLLLVRHYRPFVNKIGSAICPVGFTLSGRTCYSVCPSGTTAYDDYPEYCVSTLPCPIGTVEDLSGLACTKVEPVGVEPLVGSACETGYTEWTANTCYINCPQYFNENGLDCRKRAVLRRVANPTCQNWFYVVDQYGQCSMDGWYVLLAVVLAFLFIALLKLMTYTPVTQSNTIVEVPKRARSVRF